MKAVRTPESNITLTLPGAGEDRNLPAQRILVYDSELGETAKDAKAAFQTIWMPDDHEARQLEAGAGVVICITGQGHPPISVGVTDAVVPERELIDRGHVDRALGHLYGALREHLTDELPSWEQFETLGNIFPDPSKFAELWAEAVKATRPDAAEAQSQNGDPRSRADDA